MREKDKVELYRKAAVRLTGGHYIHGLVQEDAEQTGAFVEVTVWVPKAEMEKETLDKPKGS